MSLGRRMLSAGYPGHDHASLIDVTVCSADRHSCERHCERHPRDCSHLVEDLWNQEVGGPSQHESFPLHTTTA